MILIQQVQGIYSSVSLFKLQSSSYFTSFIITAKFKACDQLSEDVFVERFMNILQGFGGGISLDLLLRSDVEMEAYNNATVFQKVKKVYQTTVYKQFHCVLKAEELFLNTSFKNIGL